MREVVRIAFKPADVANIYFDRDTLPVLINVSNVDALISGTYNGYKGFQLSSDRSNPISTLDGSTQFYPASGYPGIITREVSDADGSCNTIIPFTLAGSLPKNLYLDFDDVSKEYAVDFTLSSVVASQDIIVKGNTSTRVILPLDDMQPPAMLNNVVFTLTITKWSKPNASIKITKLSTYYFNAFTGRDLKSVNNSENLFDSQMQIVPGICEQYADISVYDRYGILRKLALENELTPDHVLSIAAIDDSDGTEYALGNYIISDWNFDGISSTVGISARDKSYLFEKINIERAMIADRTLNELLGIMFAQAAGMPWRYQDDATRERCNAITVPNSWYHASDLYTMLNKLCALGMLRIYWYIDTFIVGRCS